MHHVPISIIIGGTGSYSELKDPCIIMLYGEECLHFNVKAEGGAPASCFLFSFMATPYGMIMLASRLNNYK